MFWELDQCWTCLLFFVHHHDHDDVTCISFLWLDCASHYTAFHQHFGSDVTSSSFWFNGCESTLTHEVRSIRSCANTEQLALHWFYVNNVTSLPKCWWTWWKAILSNSVSLALFSVYLLLTLPFYMWGYITFLVWFHQGRWEVFKKRRRRRGKRQGQGPSLPQNKDFRI